MSHESRIRKNEDYSQPTIHNLHSTLKNKRRMNKRDVYRWSLVVFSGLYTFFFAGKIRESFFNSFHSFSICILSHS